MYFIYYNSRPESFRVVPELNYGEVLFQALKFDRLNFQNVDELLDQTDKNYTFGGYSYDGSMKISKEDKMYCVDCYYLVSAKSYSKTSVSLIVHYLDSPIPIRSDKIVHDSINANETIQYIYYASKPFNVSLDIVYGSFNVTVKTLTT